MSEDIFLQIEQSNELVIQLRQQGQYHEALALALQNYQLVQTHLATDHPYQITVANNLAALFLDHGNYTATEPLLNEIVARCSRKEDENYEEYAQSLNNLADFYRRTGKYVEAIQFYQQAIDIWRAALGETHSQLAIGLNNLAQVYKTYALYESAEPLFLQALEILHTQLGEQSAEYLQTLNNLAGLYEAQGYYAQAGPLYLQILSTQREKVGELHPDVATALNNLAGFYITQGRYVDAFSLYSQALEIWRTTFGEEHPAYLTTLNNLAFVHKQQGQYSEARKLYQRIITLRKNTLGFKHPSTANSLHSLASLYEILGKYASAQRLYRQALAIRKEVLGEHHPSTATTLHNLAALYFTIGNYPKALHFYQQAFALRKAALGERHPLLASTLNNLAGVYHNMGNDNKAVELQRQANELYRATMGEHHPDYAVHLHNLALFTFSQGHYVEARQLYQQAITLRVATSGEHHPEMAPSLHNLAVLHQMTGDYVQAEELYQRALIIERQMLGEHHAETAASLHNLALLHHMQGHYTEAQQLYLQASGTWRQTIGQHHPYLISNLNNLAILFVAQKQEQQALHALQEAAAISDRVIGSIFSTSSEQQRMAYLAAIRSHYDTFLSLIFLQNPANSPLAQTGLDLVLRRKALGIEALQIQRSVVWKGKYPNQKKMIRELEEVHMCLANMILAGPGTQNVEIYQQQLSALLQEIEDQESQLARQIPEMKLTRQLRSANWQTIAQALPQGSALVEFVRFGLYNFQAIPAQGDIRWFPACYAVFVLHAGEDTRVTMLKLDEARIIDQLVADFRSILAFKVAQSDSPVLAEARKMVLDQPSIPAPRQEESGEMLRQKIFDPLIPALEGCTQLFLALDGDLARIPFEVLPLEEANGIFLLDRYQFRYLSSGRDVLRFKTRVGSTDEAPFVLANPNFDLAHPVSGAQVLESSHIPFLPLPYTQKEGTQIANILGVSLCSGKKALKSRLRQLHAPLLLHMATHGFFAPDGVSSSPQEQIFLNILQEGRMERLVKGHIKDPLLRSGLALAGANTWMHGEQLPDSAENGILTAVDVTNMDLQGTELVVLSACQTGLGDVHDGEGVFGLRRAFVIAGAKRLVMSLWRVPDQQTQELMSLFYEALRRGIPCSDALHEAQQCLKQTHTHPFYWGAFICQGDPAPLPTSVFQRSTGGASIKISSDSSKAQRQNHKRNGG